MKNELFIRFTNSIEADIERGTSILTESDNEVSEGLCAFFGKDTIEATRVKAASLGKSVANPGDTFVIVSARENINAKKGTLGTIIFSDTIELIETGTI